MNDNASSVAAFEVETVLATGTHPQGQKGDPETVLGQIASVVFLNAPDVGGGVDCKGCVVDCHNSDNTKPEDPGEAAQEVEDNELCQNMFPVGASQKSVEGLGLEV